MFNQSTLEKIKLATNLKNLAEEYGAKLTSAGNNLWQGRCPHPEHNDSTPSFRLWFNKNQTWTWCCMGCHCGQKDLKNKLYGTDCFAFLQWITDYKDSKRKITFVEAVKILAQKAGIPIEEEKFSEELKQIYLQANAYHKAMPKTAENYLISRGLDKCDIMLWKLGFSCFAEKNSHGKIVQRITFPLLASYNKILGFSSRKIFNEDDDIPKYKNSPNSEWFHKRNYFYGSHILDDSLDYAIITEGVFDVILAHKYGLKNVLAPLGTSFTDEHAEILKAKCKTPVFCMDGDDAGRKSIQKAVEKMSDLKIYSKILLLPDGMDLADLANKLKHDLPDYFAKHTIFYWQYILKGVTEEYENLLQEVRMKMLPTVKKACSSIQTEDEKIMIKNYIRERLNLNVEL